MRRIAVFHAVLMVAMLLVLLAGCSSTTSTSRMNTNPVESEVMVAGYEVEQVAGSFESLPMELSMPFWFLSGK